MKKLLVSVSGGRTSALMAKLLWDRYQDKYEMIFVFANTSREREETLWFVHQLEIEFKLPIVWVEAVVHHGSRKGSTHRIVSYWSACRDGSVFEEVIKKYSIPCSSAPHCTRELKRNAINSYAKEVGFSGCLTAIGYRADEPKRVNLIKAEKKRQWYPLYEWGIRKTDVAAYWLKQEFDLGLKDYEGNCKLCYKKSKRKLLTSLVERPQDAEWVRRMELEHGYVVPPAYSGEKPLKFFRGWESIDEIIEESKQPFEMAIDQSLITDSQVAFDFELDEQEDCAESCEPFPLDDPYEYLDVPDNIAYEVIKSASDGIDKTELINPYIKKKNIAS